VFGGGCVFCWWVVVVVFVFFWWCVFLGFGVSVVLVFVFFGMLFVGNIGVDELCVGYCVLRHC